MSCKLVVIDDHPLVRQGLIAILKTESQFEIVGEAENISQSVKLIKSLQPDIVITDLRLGKENGLNLIRIGQEEQLNCKFVVLTSSTEEEDFFEAEKLGVSGYLLKESLPEEVVHAIKVIYQGRKYYDPSVLEIKMNGRDLFEEDLTPREREVLAALGKGLSNRDIASRMYVTENTIKKHVSQILAKLDLTDRTQAALYAYSRGLVQSSN